ncbi:hypothetical protein T12_5148 [Trichinella patagoniensis]|uniref:Uncharacterized protein n=1 Tax=Trichinella patagoniensis TaxID=990121 RepID=A0A0V1A0J5_9BILA|nr:hypothetical protein T12_5148 [Trichinella patagoniensis]
MTLSRNMLTLRATSSTITSANKDISSWLLHHFSSKENFTVRILSSSLDYAISAYRSYRNGHYLK